MKASLNILFLFLSLNISAKPIIYNVPDLIGSARFVDEVVITGYDTIESKIKFQSLEYKDTLSEAGCYICKGFNYPNPDHFHWTNNMPYVGDTVLIIVNRIGAVVFGKKKDEY